MTALLVGLVTALTAVSLFLFAYNQFVVNENEELRNRVEKIDRALKEYQEELFKIKYDTGESHE